MSLGSHYPGDFGCGYSFSELVGMCVGMKKHAICDHDKRKNTIFPALIKKPFMVTLLWPMRANKDRISGLKSKISH